MDQLHKKIEEIIHAADGEWGIVIEDLNLKKKFSINEKQLFAAQSIIKVPIMAAVYKAYEQGEFKLSDPLPLLREQLVGGAGVLQHFSPGTELSIYDLVMLMIIQSDNTATNILIELVGFDRINQVMQAGGMKESRLKKKLMILPHTKEDVENYISAEDIHIFYKNIAYGKVVSGYSCLQMIEILKKQQFRNAIPYDLPENDREIIGSIPEWELANKTGWDSNYQHDVGILYVQDRSAIITALSKNAGAKVSLNIISKIGKEVYEYLKLVR